MGSNALLVDPARAAANVDGGGGITTSVWNDGAATPRLAGLRLRPPSPLSKEARRTLLFLLALAGEAAFTGDGRFLGEATLCRRCRLGEAGAGAS
jgi:hypothetical protein